jgi:hypothetical protein
MGLPHIASAPQRLMMAAKIYLWKDKRPDLP